MLKTLTRPKVFLPVLMIGAGIGALFAIGNPNTIFRIIGRFNPVDLLWIFLLTLIYEAGRLIQWAYLLDAIGVRVPFRAKAFSFAGREALRYLPAGDFAENYLLSAAEGVDFGYTSSVTAMASLFEVGICLAGLVLLGLGSWWQIRPGIVGTVGAFLLLVWLVNRFHLHGSLEPPGWVEHNARRHHVWEVVAKELRQFWKGAKRMLHWRIMAINFVVTAAYLVAAGANYYVLLAGLGWHATPFGAAVMVYFFNLAVLQIFPLPSDLGISELTSVGAFLLVGVDKDVAISVVLLSRGLGIVFPLIISAAVFALTPDEVKKALRGRKEMRGSQQRRGGAGHDEVPAPAAPNDGTSDAPQPQPLREERAGRDARPPERHWIVHTEPEPWEYREYEEQAEEAKEAG